MKTTISKSLLIFFIIFSLLSCRQSVDINDVEIIDFDTSIRAVDISSFPEISLTNPVFYNSDGLEEGFLSILKNAGVNTIRLRLWVNPVNEHSGFNEVKLFSENLRSLGFKIWLSLHYSDTWADPGNQTTPALWQNLSYNSLKDSVSSYTSRVVKEMDPDLIQVGNEINSGFLLPAGDILNQPLHFLELLNSGIQAIRDNSDKARIIIHIAGFNTADWFYSQINNLDYDIIGISYYPIWHGKDLNALRSSLSNLSIKYNKQIIIAETAYPFTLGFNDWTNNIVGLDEQLILPQYPATEQGQKDLIKEIKNIVLGTEKGIGFCYWGAELISWNGPQSTNGSPWENQALFDFNNKVLPVISEFKKE